MENEKDFLKISNANSFMISSSSKVGKITFVSYLVQSLFKENALIFTPQESFLFQRRTKSLEKQFPQFKGLNNIFTPYYLKKEWNTLKQKYGFSFFLQELEYIIVNVKQNIIVMHRFEEYFEFQDRYEIDTIFKALVKLVSVHNKKILFLSSSKHENYDYIHTISDEFSDVLVSISINEKNERIVNIKDILHNQEYPYMKFSIQNEAFLLDYYQETQDDRQIRTKNILIAQLDENTHNISAICKYIFNREGFNIKEANSLQTILQEVFISPDVIVVMMKRTQQNLETVKSIKKQLPNTFIITVLDQEFVRAEDTQEAYSYGCDELFSNTLSLDTLVLALQKTSQTMFYSEAIKNISPYDNILSNLNELKEIVRSSIEKSIFFSIFIFKSIENEEKIDKIGRKYDFLYQEEEDKVYYLALNTNLKEVKYILKKHKNFELEKSWSPILEIELEDFFR